VGLTAAMVHYFRRPPHSISPAKAGEGWFLAALGYSRSPSATPSTRTSLFTELAMKQASCDL